MVPASIGGAGGKSVGTGLTPMALDTEIYCPQGWRTLEWGGIGGRRGVPSGRYSGTASGTVPV